MRKPITEATNAFGLEAAEYKALLVESAAHWRKLADAETRDADDLQARGLYAQVQRNKAKMFNDTARSIELEIETGKAHCTVCLGPHDNQYCPQRPNQFKVR